MHYLNVPTISVHNAVVKVVFYIINIIQRRYIYDIYIYNIREYYNVEMHIAAGRVT